MSSLIFVLSHFIHLRQKEQAPEQHQKRVNVFVSTDSQLKFITTKSFAKTVVRENVFIKTLVKLSNLKYK